MLTLVYSFVRLFSTIYAIILQKTDACHNIMIFRMFFIFGKDLLLLVFTPDRNKKIQIVLFCIIILQFPPFPAVFFPLSVTV